MGELRTREPRPALRIAIPAYFYPFPDDPFWARMGAAGPSVALIVADPADGPGERRDSNYVAAIDTIRQRGTRVLGYVTIRYGDSPVASVINEIQRWFATYRIDGIFVDEVATSTSHLRDCETVYAYVKRVSFGSGLVVLNPGTRGPVDYMSAADILVTNESTWATYRDRYLQPPEWVAAYPDHRFWHLIHDSPTEPEMRMALRLARERNAGWVFVTDHTGANAYARLPPDSYWTSMLAAAARDADGRGD
jgi:hypothetical protein